METYFENRTKLTESMIFNSIKSMKMWIPLVIMYLVGLCFVLIAALGAGLIEAFYLIFAIMTPLVVAALIAHPWLETKVTMSKLRRIYGQQIPLSTTSFGEQIKTDESGGYRTLEYAQITAVRRLPDCYAIVFDGISLIFFDPNGFTKGTFEEFKQFLRKKRPDLKIPE